MCIAFLAWQVHPQLPLVLAGNRDEFYARPTMAAHWWHRPEILAGKDMKAGGTWLAVSKSGRFAFVTNVRQANAQVDKGMSSRGMIIPDLLDHKHSLDIKLERLGQKAQEYPGFNLIVGDTMGGELYFASNRVMNHAVNTVDAHAEFNVKALGPGVYGLSNASIDVPWFKIQDGKAKFSQMIVQLGDRRLDATQLDGLRSQLLTLLQNEEQAPSADLPQTGLAPPIERLFSTIFIKTPLYGTRNSTIVLAAKQANELHFSLLEQNYMPKDPMENSNLWQWRKKMK